MITYPTAHTLATTDWYYDRRRKRLAEVHLPHEPIASGRAGAPSRPAGFVLASAPAVPRAWTCDGSRTACGERADAAVATGIERR